MSATKGGRSGGLVWEVTSGAAFRSASRTTTPERAYDRCRELFWGPARRMSELGQRRRAAADSHTRAHYGRVAQWSFSRGTHRGPARTVRARYARMGREPCHVLPIGNTEYPGSADQKRVPVFF